MLLKLIKKKNKQRKKALRTKAPSDIDKFKQLRRETKQMIRKEQANKLRDSMLENPKRFLSLIKSSTKLNQKPSFLIVGQVFVSALSKSEFSKSIFSLCV